MTALSVRSLPFALACLLAAIPAPAQAGTAETPEVADPSGDVEVEGLDLTGVWFEATATQLLVHVERAADGVANVQCAESQCVGAGSAVRVLFTVLKPDGTPAPAPEGG